MNERFTKRRAKRIAWSRNAVLAKERKRMEQSSLPMEDFRPVKLPKIPKAPFDLRVRLERRDGGTLNFTLRHFYGKLIGQNVNMTPKQFGRKLGEIFEVWMMD